VFDALTRDNMDGDPRHPARRVRKLLTARDLKFSISALRAQKRIADIGYDPIVRSAPAQARDHELPAQPDVVRRSSAAGTSPETRSASTPPTT
jgi:hypothetical protein